MQLGTFTQVLHIRTILTCTPHSIKYPRQIMYFLLSLHYTYRGCYTTALHSIFTTNHDNKNCYVRMLLVITTQNLIKSHSWNCLEKWTLWGWVPHNNWILDCLTNRPQTVRISSHISSTFSGQQPPGLCAQQPPVHSVHPWLLFQTSRELYCEAYRLHRHHHQPHYEKRLEFISGGNQQPCWVVHREQPTAQC